MDAMTVMNARGLSTLGVAVILLGSVPACATGWSSAEATGRYRVTGEELVATNTRTVYEALQRLRPTWMTARGPVSATDPTEARANVYMYGSRLGDLDYLREISVGDVEEVRYWPAAQASARFGMGNPRGVIEIVPRR